MSPGGQLLHNASLLLWWAAACWLLWRVLNWRRDWFVATDKRFLLFYGFIRRRVAMMPLLKVTDMTYDRSILGRDPRLRQVRARVGRPGPGAVEHRPRAGCRHPLPRDLHPALRARARCCASPPARCPHRQTAARRRRRAVAVAVARPTARMPVGRLPRARAVEPRAGRRERPAEPDQHARSRGTAARTSAARCTWATPARSRSCGSPRDDEDARSTRRRTGPNAADRTASARSSAFLRTTGAALLH